MAQAFNTIATYNKFLHIYQKSVDSISENNFVIPPLTFFAEGNKDLNKIQSSDLKDYHKLTLRE